MNDRCVSLLGRRDQPTDALEEYCHFLGVALAAHGISLRLERVLWHEFGWKKALAKLEAPAEEQKNHWVLIQYTALAWSRRGIPLRLASLVRFLQKHGARCGVVFHDAQPYGGNRLVDRVRRQVQTRLMQRLASLADLAVLTVPREKVKWLRADARNIVFIPVGANLPSPETAWAQEKGPPGRLPTVSVFSLSDGRVGEDEVQAIVRAMIFVAKEIGRVRLLVFGRHAKDAEKLLRESLRATDVELDLRGILSTENAVRALGESDVMLFARGPISSRRGSAIAGIACGLPVVAEEGLETAAPITEAGVVLVKHGEPFGPALLRVLSDSAYRESLSDLSREAQRNHFSWEAIAKQYIAALRGREET